MSREKLVEDIITFLGQLTAEIEAGAGSNLQNRNIYAETTILRLLNEVFDFDLKNANNEELNYPSIDLFDRDNRIAVQVTSKSSNVKVKDTLQGFVKNGLYKEFDTLYIYILTKKTKIKGVGFDEIIEHKFNFNKKTDIIDKADIINEITGMKSLTKIRRIKNILKEELSEEKALERRKVLKEASEQKGKEDNIYVNLLKVNFPESFYTASLNYEKEEIIKKAKEEGLYIHWKQKNNPTFIGEIALKLHSGMKSKDWIIWNDKLFTFRDLNVDKELSSIIDLGTIEENSCTDFYEEGNKYVSVFKYLLLRTIEEELKMVGIERYKYLFRFATNPIVPNEVKKKWKYKKTATRTVVKEIEEEDKEGNKKIVAFSHLAMELEIHFFYDTWYVCVSPTYSFSNSSNLSKKWIKSKERMAWIKRQEKNQAVFYSFKFISYQLTHKMDFNWLSFFDVPPSIIPKLVFDEIWSNK